MILRIWRFLMEVLSTASDRHISVVAAGVAFYGIFAIFPGIAAVISIFGLVADPVVVVEQLELLRDVIPAEAYVLIEVQTRRLLAAQSGALGWATGLSIVLALWAARAGVAGLMGALNAIADRPPRGGVKQALVALALTICLVALAITALVVVVVVPVLLAFFPLAGSSAVLLETLRWAIALFVLYSALALLYRFGPNQRGSGMRWLTVGAATAVILWIGSSAGLSFYLANFGNYNEIYGSLGAVIGMLLWLYVTAYLILLGAALNLKVHGGVAGRPRR